MKQYEAHLFQIPENCFTHLGRQRVVLFAPLPWAADVKDVTLAHGFTPTFWRRLQPRWRTLAQILWVYPAVAANQEWAVAVRLGPISIYRKLYAPSRTLVAKKVFERILNSFVLTITSFGERQDSGQSVGARAHSPLAKPSSAAAYPSVSDLTDLAVPLALWLDDRTP